MNAKIRQYLLGLVFLGVGIYHYFINDFLELALYGSAGLAFIVNGLTLEEKLLEYKKPLVIVSWILIGTTGILFLWLLQFKYF
jgi:hypothetical protein